MSTKNITYNGENIVISVDCDENDTILNALSNSEEVKNSYEYIDDPNDPDTEFKNVVSSPNLDILNRPLCGSGLCKHCIVSLTDGEIDYLLDPIYLKENYLVDGSNYIMPCIAKPKTDCTIERIPQEEIDIKLSSFNKRV